MRSGRKTITVQPLHGSKDRPNRRRTLHARSERPARHPNGVFQKEAKPGSKGDRRGRSGKAGAPSLPRVSRSFIYTLRHLRREHPCQSRLPHEASLKPTCPAAASGAVSSHVQGP